MLPQSNVRTSPSVPPNVTDGGRMLDFTYGDFNFRKGTYHQLNWFSFFAGAVNPTNCYCKPEPENPLQVIHGGSTNDNCSLTARNSTNENPNLLHQHEVIKDFDESYCRWENRRMTGLRYQRHWLA